MSSFCNEHFPYIIKVKTRQNVYSILLNNNLLITYLFLVTKNDVLIKCKGVQVILKSHKIKYVLSSKHKLPFVFFKIFFER